MVLKCTILKIFLILFQCPDKDTPDGNHTLHIISHYRRCKVDKMRWYFKRWMETEAHETFIENIASDLLKRKGLSVQEYCDNIVKLGWPLDKIGLVLFACLYKIHICVFVEGKFWTTDRKETIKSADIYLVYCDKLRFFDTVQKGRLSEGLLTQIPVVTYYFRSKSLEKEKIPCY